MSETPETPETPETGAAPAADDPLTLYGADAVSGARFLRWNLAATVLGAIGVAAGLAATPARAASPPPPRSFQLERLAEDVTLEVPAGSRTVDHLRVSGDGLPWEEIWLEGGDAPSLVRWKQGDQIGELGR